MTAMRELTPTPTTPTRKKPRRAWGVLALSVTMLVMVVYLLSAYVPPDISTSRIPITHGDLQYVLLVAHIFTAAVATVAGLAQLWPWLRRKYPVAHRWTGRAYFFLGVFPSSVLAIPVIAMAPMGVSNQAALAVLDVLWMISGIAGYRSARQRKFADHRKWMIRNYGLTFASIASRFWIPVLGVTMVPELGGVPYQGDPNGIAAIHDVASGSAWLGLMVTMVVVEWYIQRRYGVPKTKPQV
ncbi:MAG TPA: DUF2306 domain-containing protein [Pseudonocardiaceae bacterium]|nr:DUF2306 domain-containing protein [Pseudonocardiaceae bacterium]